MVKPMVMAGGAVVLRHRQGTDQVALIHRPKYDDWSLPKGKLGPDELAPVAAVREVLEETGLEVRLGMPLGTVQYPIENRTKRVYWWRARLVHDESRIRPPDPDHTEVDARDWFDVDEAMSMLTYEDERDVLAGALGLPATWPLVVVRHAKAMDRKNWSGKDADRRLTERGRRQARRIADTLAAYGVEALASSSSTRCMDTLRPYANRDRVPITPLKALSEEGAAADPGEVGKVMDQLVSLMLERQLGLAVCGHRPVLPLMFKALGVGDEPMKPAAVRVLHWSAAGTISQEHFPPAL